MTRANIGENTRVTRSMSRENEALAPKINDIVENALNRVDLLEILKGFC